MPDNVSRERKRIISAFGAQIDLQQRRSRAPTAPSCSVARSSPRSPEHYFKPDQYFNPLNPQAHYREHRAGDLGGDRRARSRTSSPASAPAARSWAPAATSRSATRPIQVIAAEPDDALHGLEGLKHMASSIVPGIYHEEELDAKVPVPTDDAYDLVYQLGARRGPGRRAVVRRRALRRAAGRARARRAASSS